MLINIAYEKRWVCGGLAIVMRLIFHRRLDKLYHYRSNPNIKHDV